MKSLAVLMLARHPGPGFEPLAGDIAAITRPGDHVVVVADDASPETAFRTGRFLSQAGFGPGVAATRLLTGTAGEGDTGVAVNLGLQALSVPGAARDRLLVVGPGSRIDAAGFAAARALAEERDLDLLAFPLRQWCPLRGRVIDGPDLAAAGDAHALRPGLDGMLLRWTLAATLRCTEGGTSHGDLVAWWQALAKARARQIWGSPLGHRGPEPEPDAGVAASLADLVARHPEAADWASAALPRLLVGLTPGAITGLLAAGPALATALAGTPGADAPLLQAFGRGDAPAARQVLYQIARASQAGAVAPEQSRFPAPALSARAPLAVHVTGAHSHRTPLAYTYLAPLWEGAITLTPDAETADLIVLAHPHNARALGPAATAAMARGTPLALISEEPFWDTLFSPDPLAHRITVGTVRMHQVNHHRSAIFDFDHIPYYLLTEPIFVARYAAALARNAQRSAADWQADFAARPTDVTFMAERRPEAFHNVTLPQGDVIGLCAWRTELALACNRGVVARLGASWGTGPSRFTLTDWHADKLAQLDGQTRMLSGIENTHQPTYMTEKLFDAFACGALPLYVASPGHRLRALGLPPGAWLNLWDTTPAQAAERIAAAEFGPGFCADYAAAQRHLAALFNDAGIVARERARLGRTLVAEVRRLVELGPA